MLIGGAASQNGSGRTTRDSCDENQGELLKNSIEYNGYVIEPTTRLAEEQDRWTLEVRISPADGDSRARRCHASNTYPSKDVAVERCLKFGKQIVDGKARRKAKPSK
jgi:hypothetical protein